MFGRRWKYKPMICLVPAEVQEYGAVYKVFSAHHVEEYEEGDLIDDDELYFLMCEPGFDLIIRKLDFEEKRT